jgi:hypothetical protein
MVDAGCSTSGMVYYLYECYGGDGWNPESKDQQVRGKFEATDGFQRKARCSIMFNYKSIDDIRSFAPGIDEIDK